MLENDEVRKECQYQKISDERTGKSQQRTTEPRENKIVWRGRWRVSQEMNARKN